MIVRSYRVIKFAFQNFKRNFWLSMVTISILTLALLSLNFFIVLSALLDHTVSAVEDKVNVTVYFQATAQDSDITAFESRIKGLPEVASVQRVSKDEALNRLKARYQGDPQIAESIQQLDQNPLTESAIIKAGDVEGYPAILAVISDPQYSSLIERQSFTDRTQIINRIAQIKTNIQRIGIAVTIFFAIVAMLIIINTIRMTIYARRREVGIMKLVGATNGFIRAPLIFESLMYCVCSILLTILIVFPLLSAAQPTITKLFDSQALDVLGYFSDHFFFIFGYEFLAALVLTMFSSLVAIGRYLKV